MTAWIYVLAFVAANKSIGFHHLVVMAVDESDAYAEGGRSAKAAGLLPPPEGQYANDYVIQLVQP